jgi:hypothetical protein
MKGIMPATSPLLRYTKEEDDGNETDDIEDDSDTEAESRLYEKATTEVQKVSTTAAFLHGTDTVTTNQSSGLTRSVTLDDVTENPADFEAMLKNPAFLEYAASQGLSQSESQSQSSLQGAEEQPAKLMLQKKTVILDATHGNLSFEPVCMKFINTPQFQRLRKLKQLGTTFFVFPSATHTRFEHSLGVAHLAEMVCLNLQKEQPELDITTRDILCVKLAGLCHDLGHGPFSHVFDGLFMPSAFQRRDPPEKYTWKHEQGSVDMIYHLLDANNIDLKSAEYCKTLGLSEPFTEKDLWFIEEQIMSTPPQRRKGRSCLYDPANPHTLRTCKSFLYDIVSNVHSGLDVDKLDYYNRDSASAGIKTSCDFTRLLTLGRACLVDERSWRFGCTCNTKKCRQANPDYQFVGEGGWVSSLSLCPTFLPSFLPYFLSFFLPCFSFLSFLSFPPLFSRYPFPLFSPSPPLSFLASFLLFVLASFLGPSFLPSVRIPPSVRPPFPLPSVHPSFPCPFITFPRPFITFLPSFLSVVPSLPYPSFS